MVARLVSALLVFTTFLQDLEAAEGQNFMVAFPLHPVTVPNIAVTSSHHYMGLPINVTVTAPGSEVILPTFNFSLSGGEHRIVLIPSAFTMMQSAKYRNYSIRITSDRAVWVHAFSYNLNTAYSKSAAALLVLPFDHLSVHYVVLTSCEFKHCLVLVGSPFCCNDVEVKLFMGTTTATVTYENQDYVNGSVIQETLRKNEVMQILSDQADLSGSEVTSSKKVMVICGGERFRRDSTTWRDAAIEMIPPVDGWGQEFVLFSGYLRTTIVYVVFAQERPGTVEFTGDHVTLDWSSASGNVQWFEVEPFLVTALTTTQPAMVIVYPTTFTQDPGKTYNPSLSIVVPTDSWLTSYSLPTFQELPIGSITVFLVLVTSINCTDAFWKNGMVTSPSWVNDTSTWAYKSTFVDVTGDTVVSLSSGCPFTGFVYGEAWFVAFSTSLGWDYQPVPPTTESTSTSGGSWTTGEASTPQQAGVTDTPVPTDETTDVTHQGTSDVTSGSTSDLATLLVSHAPTNVNPDLTIHLTSHVTAPFTPDVSTHLTLGVTTQSTFGAITTTQMTSNVTAQWTSASSFRADGLCNCTCSNASQVVHTLCVSATKREKERVRKQLVHELALNASTLSARVRRKTSASNRKASSAYMGSFITVIVFTALTVFIVVPDLVVFSTWLASKKWFPRSPFNTL